MADVGPKVHTRRDTAASSDLPASWRRSAAVCSVRVIATVVSAPIIVEADRNTLCHADLTHVWVERMAFGISLNPVPQRVNMHWLPKAASRWRRIG